MIGRNVRFAMAIAYPWRAVAVAIFLHTLALRAHFGTSTLHTTEFSMNAAWPENCFTIGKVI